MRDVVSRIQLRARLHGPGQARRAVHATLLTLAEVLPGQVFRVLAAGLPVGARVRSPYRGAPQVTGRHAFLAHLAHRLVTDRPTAAFIARAVFEELNATGRPLTPASVAHLVPADLRPLLTARATDRPGTPRRSRAGVPRRGGSAAAVLRHRAGCTTRGRRTRRLTERPGAGSPSADPA